MRICPATTCSLFIAVLLMFCLSVNPASGQEALKEANELNQRAMKLQQAGKLAEAIPLARRALELREQALGPTHPDVATSLSGLAGLLLFTADYAEGKRLYERALTIYEQALGPTHPYVATSLFNLGAGLVAIGDHAGALPLLERALKIQEQGLGPTHPAMAKTLSLLGVSRLGVSQLSIENIAEARLLLERALKLQEQALGQTHPDVAPSLILLGSLLVVTGDYAGARPLLERALKIQEQALGPAHPDVAGSLMSLAVLLHTTGDYAGARGLFERALNITEQTMGSSSMMIPRLLSALGRSEAGQQHYQVAFGIFQKGLLIQDNIIQNIFSVTTEEQKFKLIQSVTGLYGNFLSLIHQHLKDDPKAVREGLAIVLRHKGVVFDAEARQREALQGRLSETGRQDWNRLTALRSELARLLLNKPEKMSLEGQQDKLATLHQQIADVEKKLVAESALVAKELQQRKITVEALAKRLPKNAVLVEFVKIKDRNWDFTTKTKETKKYRYLSFLLTESGDVTLFDLGDADALEALAQRALADIKTSLGTRGIEILKAPCDRSVDPRGIEIVKAPCERDAGRQSAQLLQELHARVWAPMEKALGRADKVVLSPDGLLNLVPFAALVDSQGRSLVERYQLAYVTSGRELIGVEGALPRPDSDLLLVANPSFDQKGSDAGRQGTALRSREFRGVFTPLPGTERESREIPPLVVAPKEQKQVLVGERATETAVKTARSPRILHLATHGFFLPDDESALDTVKFGDLPDRGITVVPRPASKRYENPLVRSGLAFSGANHATGITDGDDGILTALEITGMDLYGTELVVLSACDTGVGEIKTGEGVFGLRRAFALAGAKNLLMSLWEVSDEVTARQMKMFYQNLQKLPKAEALRQAQLETIKELKAQYDGMAPPGLWAPFILQGAQALGQ